MHSDIIKIHSQIINHYTQFEKDIKDLEMEIDLFKSIPPCNLNQTQKEIVEEHINKLNKHVGYVKKNSYINFFNFDTLHILHAYKTIINTPIKQSFTCDHYEATDDIYKSKTILVNKFTKLFNELGFEYTTISKTTDSTSTVETTRTGETAKYDRMTHFKNTLANFQGKQYSITAKVLQGLDDKIKLYNIEKVTKGHIKLFLKDMKLSKYYDDINYIYCYYNHCFDEYDISHLEHALVDDFSNILQVYDTIEIPIKRKNFISIQYVLYHLLKRRKFPCSITDFNIIKSVDRLGAHDDIMKSIFDILGWEFA
jgi:hypothetical protein